GCADVAGGYSYDLNAQNLHDTETGWRSRANLSWHITPNVMVYYTFSQGYRPGGFNQNGGTLHAPGPDGVDQYAVPKSYRPDSLTNNELGWKTVLLDHHLEWDGAIYQENWNNVQVEFFDPGLVGNIFYDTNGQNFVVKGLETSFIARLAPGLTLQGAASWNRSSQVNSPALIDNNPASVNYG
ncbi:TonB-dependent receptor, partial [mine drainage metagenome]